MKLRVLPLLAVLGFFLAPGLGNAASLEQDMCEAQLGTLPLCHREADCQPSQLCLSMANPCRSGDSNNAEAGAPADPSLVLHVCVNKADFKAGDTCMVISGNEAKLHVRCGSPSELTQP